MIFKNKIKINDQKNFNYFIYCLIFMFNTSLRTPQLEYLDTTDDIGLKIVE